MKDFIDALCKIKQITITDLKLQRTTMRFSSRNNGAGNVMTSGREYYLAKQHTTFHFLML